MFNADDERMPSHRRRLLFTSSDSLYSPFTKRYKKGSVIKSSQVPTKVKCTDCPTTMLITTKSGRCRRCEEKLRREALRHVMNMSNRLSERDALTIGNPQYLARHPSSLKQK